MLCLLLSLVLSVAENGGLSAWWSQQVIKLVPMVICSYDELLKITCIKSGKVRCMEGCKTPGQTFHVCCLRSRITNVTFLWPGSPNCSQTFVICTSVGCHHITVRHDWKCGTKLLKLVFFNFKAHLFLPLAFCLKCWHCSDWTAVQQQDNRQAAPANLILDLKVSGISCPLKFNLSLEVI